MRETPETPDERLAQVSVVIPAFSAMTALPTQLGALAAQDEAPPFVVLVCDNGANAGLEALARSYAPQLDVRVVDATGKPGTAFARNTGIRSADTQKLLFCDADDVVGPTWVRDGAAVLDEEPAFSGGAVPFDADELRHDLDAVWALLASRLPAYLRESAGMPLGTYPVLLGCSFGMKRDFAAELGGFDEAFGSQAEDNDLAFRVQHTHGSLPRAPHVAVAYRMRPSGEISVRRAIHAGFKHAALCARHDAWRLSPSFQGHWMLRPIKEAVTDSRHVGASVDAAGRLVGLAAGRAWFTVVPRPAREAVRSRVQPPTRDRSGAASDPTDE